MDYIADKLNSTVGGTLSSINELKRKREKQKERQASIAEDNLQQQDNEEQQVSSSAKNNAKPKDYRYPALNLAPGIPFGGDTSSQLIPQLPPPPIGFRADLVGGGRLQDEGENRDDYSRTELQQPIRGANGDSSESLYQGDAWSRLWFQRVMMLSLVRLLLFIRKVYEDFQATKTYGSAGNTGHLLASIASLFLPTIVFTIYRICRYLQVALPTLRAKLPYPDENSSADNLARRKRDDVNPNARREEDLQLQRALISSQSIANQTDEDGLVTARETPTNLEDFHDSQSQQDHSLVVNVYMEPSSPAPSTAIIKDSPQQDPQARRLDSPIEIIDKETVNVDKLGNIPDKETTRVVIGASEQILHGILFVFWQLKRQVDVLGYLVERSCLWRKPSDREIEELDRLRTGSDGLEWFQDFYAAFLAILAQVYTLGLHWASNEKSSLNTSTFHSASTGLAGLGIETSDIALSNTAKALSNVLGQRATVGDVIGGRDLLIMSQLLVSSAVVFSLLIAVRRRDDGPLTLGLSMIGWGSIFASRIIIIALAFVHIGWKIMFPLVAFHIFGITGWIYKVAIDSHCGKLDETEETKWDRDLMLNETNTTTNIDDTIADDESPKQIRRSNSDSTSVLPWSTMEYFILVLQIFTLFAIPSLFYWPIMFNLKMHQRPIKYLVLILTQNFFLVLAIWFVIPATVTAMQLYLLGIVCGLSILGFIFVSLYIACKPSLTEYFARADQLFNEADKSGIYFEFCSRVFKMPDLSKQTFRRLMNQSEQIEEIEIETRE